VFGDALSQTPSEAAARLQDLTSRGTGVAGDGPSGAGRRFESNEDSGAKDSGNAQKDKQNLHAAADKPALFAARLSHMTTDAMRDGAFHSQVLGATHLATFTAPSSSSSYETSVATRFPSDSNSDRNGSSGISDSNDNIRSGRSSTENITQSVVFNFHALFSSGYDPASDPAAVASGISTMPKRPSGTSGGTEAYTQLHLVQVGVGFKGKHSKRRTICALFALQYGREVPYLFVFRYAYPRRIQYHLYFHSYVTFSSLVAVMVVIMLSTVAVANVILRLHSGQRTTPLSLAQHITRTAVQQQGQAEQTIYRPSAAG